MNYYGTRLTENISRREPEGYLLCLNVPVARIGYQEYLPEELGLPSTGGFINVYRPEEEVFSPETMASFEGMPVTNDHPAEGVDITNIRALGKGHAHNVRRGTGDEADLLLADLIIQDPALIHLIMDEGKREISCGYTYELCEENGKYIQRQIRGNHVAVVDAGRAGHRVCIKDHKTMLERSKRKMKKSLYKKLVRMAKDGDPEAIEALAELAEEAVEAATPAEAVAEVIEEVVPAAAATAAAGAAEDPTAVIETPEGTTVVVDEATLEGVLERLDQIITLLTPAAADDDPVEEMAEAIEEAIEAVETEEAMTDEEGEELPVEAGEEVAAILEQIMDPITEVVEEMTDEDDPDNQEVLCTGDALRAALHTMRPALKKMSRKQRKRACADIAARINRQRRKTSKGNDSIAKLTTTKKKAASRSADLGKRIMASRNANFKK